MRKVLFAGALALLLLLSACSPIYRQTPAAEQAAATSTPGETPFGVWAGRVDCAPGLIADFPAALPDRSGPFEAAVSLRIGEDGACFLTVDYAPCASPLQTAIAGLLRELERTGEELPGEAAALAAAMADELLPPTLRLEGRLTAEQTAVRWQNGESSTVLLDGGRLRFALPELGQLNLAPGE